MSERIICPPDHGHGENSTCRSLHHCKCVACTEAAKLYEFWRQGQIRAGRPLMVPAVGTIRRMRALQRLGWSLRVIAEAAGYSESWSQGITRQTTVSRRTAETVRRVYDLLSMRIPSQRTTTERSSVMRAKNYAARQGWAAPLDWDEDEIDRPDGRPAGMEKAA